MKQNNMIGEFKTIFDLQKAFPTEQDCINHLESILWADGAVSLEPSAVTKIISFLCSESGSHDYTIYRKEAKDELGLNIDKPDDELYGVIKSIYQNIEQELELRNPYNPNILLAQSHPNPCQYTMRRALIESINGCTDIFISEGTLSKVALPNGVQGIQDNRTFDGWKHEN